MVPRPIYCIYRSYYILFLLQFKQRLEHPSCLASFEEHYARHLNMCKFLAPGGDDEEFLTWRESLQSMFEPCHEQDLITGIITQQWNDVGLQRTDNPWVQAILTAATITPWSECLLTAGTSQESLRTARNTPGGWSQEEDTRKAGLRGGDHHRSCSRTRGVPRFRMISAMKASLIQPEVAVWRYAARHSRQPTHVVLFTSDKSWQQKASLHNTFKTHRSRDPRSHRHQAREKAPWYQDQSIVFIDHIIFCSCYSSNNG